jgi:hypothetical protein
MKKIYLPALTLLFLNYCCAQQFQLAPPVLKYATAFFIKSTTALLKFEQPSTKIYYTLDNTEPTEKSSVYASPLVITKNLTTLKAKVFGKGFLPSETVQVTFIKDGIKIEATEQPKANDKFPGNGAETLFDNKGGIADLNSKSFLGYMQDSVEINITLAKKEKIDSVLIDFLQDHGSWIFLPQKIKTYYFNEVSKSYELISHKEILSNTVINGSSTIFQVLKSDKKVISDKLKIVIEPLQSMPEGHPGKGKPGWLFIDEIKIY